jgi:two-component system, NarL family, response regulator
MRIESLNANASTRRIRVLVADDHKIVRRGVMAMLSEFPDIDVAGEADDGAAALDLFASIRPDVALVDLRMPKMDGVLLVETLRARYGDVRVIVLSTFDTDDDIERVLRAGAKAFLLKDVSSLDLVSCVRAVHQGRRWLGHGLAARLADRVTRDLLTPREMTVLRELASGKSNKQIAAVLGIVEGTVKLHVTRVYEKLGVSSRTEAMGTALRRGLLRLPG